MGPLTATPYSAIFSAVMRLVFVTPEAESELATSSCERARGG